MTDKKRIGGSCDFLIKQERRNSWCLGDLKSVSSERARQWTGEKPATAQLGFVLVLDAARAGPKVMVDKCVHRGGGTRQDEGADG